MCNCFGSMKKTKTKEKKTTRKSSDASKNTSTAKMSTSSKSTDSRMPMMLTGNLTQFSVDLLRQLYSHEKNLVFSPLSLINPLMMLLVGAEAETRNELLKVLVGGKTVPSDDQVDGFLEQFCKINKELLDKAGKALKIANLIYTNKRHPLLPAYLESIQSRFHATAKSLDIENHAEKAMEMMNLDVSLATSNHILGLITSLSPLTRCVLLNAVYFRAKWAEEFDTDDTKDAEFYKAAGQTVKCALMEQTDENGAFAHFEDHTTGTKSIELKYEASVPLSMVLVLPKEGTPMKNFLATLTGSNFELLLSNLKTANREVKLKLPRFDLTGTHLLIDPLKRLGIKRAFDPNTAQLTRMAFANGLAVTEIIQKCLLQVTEQGTLAVAATAMKCVACCANSPPKEAPFEFTADRPFLFALVSKESKQILFIGVVEDPNRR